MKFSKNLLVLFLVSFFSLNLNAETVKYKFKQNNKTYDITMPKDFEGVKAFEQNYLGRDLSEESTREKIQTFYDYFTPVTVEVSGNDIDDQLNTINDSIINQLSKFGNQTALKYNPKLATLNKITGNFILLGIPTFMLFFILSQTIDQSEIISYSFITTFFSTCGAALIQGFTDALNHIGFINNPYHTQKLFDLIKGYYDQEDSRFKIVRFLIKDHEIEYNQEFLENIVTGKMHLN